MMRFLTTFVNIIAAIIAIFTLSMIQIEFSHKDINAIMSSRSFESTEEFSQMLHERIDETFTLINLKKSFESNNRPFIGKKGQRFLEKSDLGKLTNRHPKVCAELLHLPDFVLHYFS